MLFKGIRAIFFHLLLLLYFLTSVWTPALGQSDFRLLIDGKKYGLANNNGATLIPAVYEQLGWSNGNYEPIADLIGFKKNGSWGLISLKNKIVLEAEFTALIPVEGGFFKATKPSTGGASPLSGLLSQQGKVIIGFQYDSIRKVGEQFIVSQKTIGKDALFGLIDEKEKAILQFTFLSIDKLSDHLVLAEYSKGKHYIYSVTGQLIIDSPIERVEKHQGANQATAFMSQGKWGVLDPKGEILLKPIYKSVTSNKDNSWKTQAFDTWTVTNNSKKVLAKIEADTIIPLSQSNTLMCSNSLYSIYENSTAQYASISFECVNILDNKDLLVSENGHFGIIKGNGQTVLDLVYDTIITDSEIYYAYKNREWQMFTANGFQIGVSKYDSIAASSTALIAVKKGSDWGYIDRKGYNAIPLLYESALPFDHQWAIVKFLGYWGVLNGKGQWQLHPKYDTIIAAGENQFIVREKSRTFLINDQEKILFTTYNDLKTKNGSIEERDAFGNKRIIRPSGQPLTALHYDSISPLMANEYYIHIRNNKYSLISKEGKTVVAENAEMESIFPFDGEFIGIKKDGRFGFIDRLGNLRIANQYGAIGLWREGAAAVRLNMKWGFVDRLERLLVQPYYDSATDFNNGLSIVSILDKYGLVNSEATEVLPIEYQSIYLTHLDNYILEKSGLYGLANSQGRLVLQPQYDKIIEVSKDLILVHFNGKFGLKNLQNVDVMPAIYDSIGAIPELGVIYHKKNIN